MEGDGALLRMRHWMRGAAIIIAAMACIAAGGQQQKVILQLKWDHQFQFAGYYAALWQGFYEEAGLDVEIRPRVGPDGSLLNVMQELTEGRADFAVAAADILAARAEGVPIVVISSIFQRSPFCLMSLAEVPFTKPSDLRGRRIGFQQARGSLELEALLRLHRIEEGDFTRVDFVPGVDQLLKREFEISMDYPSNALWRARELGVELNLLYPSAYDLQFYGDTLVTHQRVVDQDVAMVRRFRDATIKGWRYAMDHPDELCRAIEEKLPRALPIRDFGGFLRFEADMVRSWMRYPEVEVGSTNSWRWASLFRQLQNHEVIARNGDVSNLVLDGSQSPTSDTPKIMSFIFFLLGAVLAIALLVVFLFTSVRHWALPLSAAAIMLAAIYMVERAQHETRVQQSRLDISNRISALRAKLESVILADSQILYALSAFIRLRPEFTPEEFRNFCADLTDLNPRIRSIIAAPDLVVRHVYPEENNEAVLGLDYRKHPVQGDAAKRTVEAKRPMVAGPLELLQGGRGVVIRMPVFLGGPDDERLWGLVGVALDFDVLLAGTGWAALNQEFDLAVRGQDATGAQGEVFFGDDGVFEQEPVLQEVVFHTGSWMIAGAPRGGWMGMQSRDWTVWAVGLLMLCLVLLMLVYRERQIREHAINAKRLEVIEATRARAQALAKVSTLKHDFVRKQITLSPEFCEMLGLPARETVIPEHDFLRFVRPNDHDRITRLNNLARNSGSKLSFDLALLREDGGVRYVHLHSEIVHDRNGRPVSAFETVQDITERHEVQEQLRQSEERFALAMLGSNDSLWDADLITGKVYYSPRFREMFHLDPDTPMEKPKAGTSLIHPDDWDRVTREFREAISSGSDKLEMEFRMLTPGQRTLDVLARAHLVRDDTGTAVRMVGTMVDVTPLKNAERETRQLHAQLQQAQKMEAIGHLAGGIAHDFNNILASILGFNELAMNGLRSGLAVERLERYLKEVELSGMRARDLVRQLLSFSRPGGGAMQPIAIETVVRDTIKMLRAMMPSTIDFEWESAEKNLFVMANPVQLNQVLLNLIINARDAMGENGTISVHIARAHAEGCACDSCHQTFYGEYVTVRVMDTGCGIPEEQLARIFEPFFTTKETGKGTGMGLAVVHGTLHSMGGHLLVKSEVGTGTAITMYLPYLPAQSVETTPDQEPEAAPKPAGGSILLAEDEDGVASFLTEALSQAGYRVVRSPNGIEAWARYKENPDSFDLLLTDQAMPGMSGSTLAEKILKQRPGFPIVLISGYSETVNEVVAAEMGIARFMAKPVRLNELLEAVSVLLGRTRSGAMEDEAAVS
jgi:PAS domain S-box-containing protein